jgi:alkylation response protein AidB-like acyl-CoA dehydrogenase
MFAYGWTEPDVGSDIASVRTTAVRDGDAIVVNGTKRFCSGAEFCDYIFVLVRTDSPANRYANLSLLLIPPHAPGVTITRIDTMGIKGVPSTDVTFTDAKVGLDALVGGFAGWNRGWDMITGVGLDVEKLEVAALALGIADAAVSDAWMYAQDRMQFGKPVSNHQVVRHLLADLRTELHAARLVMYHAAWLANRGGPCRVETSMAKLYITEAAKKIVLDAQSVLGAYGYAKDLDVERYVRDILLMPIIGGSSAIQRNNIANWLKLRR